LRQNFDHMKITAACGGIFPKNELRLR